MPTWLRGQECLALRERSHYCDYLGHDNLFLYSSSTYSCHLFLISSASIRYLPFLLFIVPSLHEMFFDISSFLEEISSLSPSVVFLYFFALITEEGFLISPCYSLELCIQMGIYFLFSLPLTSLLFSAISKASSDNYFAFLHFFFLGMVLNTASSTMSWTSIHSSSGTLSIRSNPLDLFVISTV